ARPARRLFSQGEPAVRAASEAITPRRLAPNPTPSPILARSGHDSGPARARAALRPGRFHALDADTNVNADSAATVSRDPNGTCPAPGYVNGAWISSMNIRTACRSARAAAVASSSRVNTVPVGLCGLHSR